MFAVKGEQNALDRNISLPSRTNIYNIRGTTLIHCNQCTPRNSNKFPTHNASLASANFLAALSSPYYTESLCGTHTIIRSLYKTCSAFLCLNSLFGIKLWLIISLFCHFVNGKRCFRRILCIIPTRLRVLSHSYFSPYFGLISVSFPSNFLVFLYIL